MNALYGGDANGRPALPVSLHADAHRRRRGEPILRVSLPDRHGAAGGGGGAGTLSAHPARLCGHPVRLHLRPCGGGLRTVRGVLRPRESCRTEAERLRRTAGHGGPVAPAGGGGGVSLRMDRRPSAGGRAHPVGTAAPAAGDAAHRGGKSPEAAVLRHRLHAPAGRSGAGEQLLRSACIILLLAVLDPERPEQAAALIVLGLLLGELFSSGVLTAARLHRARRRSGGVRVPRDSCAAACVPSPCRWAVLRWRAA